MADFIITFSGKNGKDINTVDYLTIHSKLTEKGFDNKIKINEDKYCIQKNQFAVSGNYEAEYLYDIIRNELKDIDFEYSFIVLEYTKILQEGLLKGL